LESSHDPGKTPAKGEIFSKEKRENDPLKKISISKVSVTKMPLNVKNTKKCVRPQQSSTKQGSNDGRGNANKSNQRYVSEIASGKPVGSCLCSGKGWKKNPKKKKTQAEAPC